MAHEDFTVHHRRLGRIPCWGGLAVGAVYTAFASLSIAADPPWARAADPFGNPFSAVASFVLIPTAAFLIACMASVHAYAPRACRR